MVSALGPLRTGRLFHLSARFCGYRRNSNHAVYGAGLSASGSFAKPSLVLKENRGVKVVKPQRLAYCNKKKIKHIAAGFGYSLFASSDHLHGSGINNFYQLGGPVRTDAHRRSEEWYIGGRTIPLPEDCGKIIGVAAGRLHSLVATTKALFAFGNNAHGQCGKNPELHPFVAHTKNNGLPRVDLPSESPIVKSLTDTSFALLEDGTLFAFGLSEDGQVGNGRFGIIWSPSKVVGDLEGEKIVSISGSTDTLIALSDKGDVFGWGQNEYGQFSAITDEMQVNLPRHLPFNIGQAVSAATTGSSCIVANANGDCYVWGYQILGLGPSMTSTKTPLHLDRPLFASATGGDSAIKQVFGGNLMMAAITESGNVYSWGSNRFGALGLGHDNDQLFPYPVFIPLSVRGISLGPDHSLFLAS
ncbi:hypothetical protein L596_003450 [Steinernema carpocapsae]|uniref:Uncharacterized protein n=1 Tax=Steinernema carpocapsae TaxID=34508 RepID=A0A4U8UVP6_STECR|nr:hypothetical protein L596_003450 [Steinernema carpocapsae]